MLPWIINPPPSSRSFSASAAEAVPRMRAAARAILVLVNIVILHLMIGPEGPAMWPFTSGPLIPLIAGIACDLRHTKWWVAGMRYHPAGDRAQRRMLRNDRRSETDIAV